MDAGLIAALSTAEFAMLAAAVVVVMALGRSGRGRATPAHRPEGELSRAREEIQRQIDRGRGGY